MALKPHYQRTRADVAELTRDAQPGDRLYTLGGEFVVAENRSALGGGHMVRPADTPPGDGSISLAQLLSRTGGIFTQPC
ncbi:hypothetical protein ACIQMY_25305 [Streptomyces sp. NPDC091368]|uniref:hypothetical protein n=1 Tax=Streptomyces sp. NPDC091368 TaxID=3365993 RepID=UPI003813A28A